MPSHRSLHVVLVATLALSACGQSDVVTGSATMPAEFGQVQTAVLSCPEVDGAFALPAAQGHPFGFAGRTGRLSRYRDFFGLPLQDASQLWVSGPRLGEAQPLTLRAKVAVRNPDVADAPAPVWPRMELSAGEYDCQEGWLNLTERDWDQPGAAAWFGGGGLRISARIARLRDGSLVVGQAVRVWGRGSAIVVGGKTLFTMQEPDRVTWYWSRFAPVTAGGVTPQAAPSVQSAGHSTATLMRDRSAVVMSGDSSH